MHPRHSVTRAALCAVLLVGVVGTFSRPATPSIAAGDPVLAQAMAVVTRATAPQTKWDGPTTGPKAQAHKLIVYVSVSQTNGGAAGVSQGVVEAGKAIGWNVKIIDGQGTVTGQTAAMNQAIALKPNGIILGGLDATSQQVLVRKAASLGIKVVGWHSAALPGPVPGLPVFTNVGSSAEATARTTADYVIAASHGKGQVVILTDSEYAVAVLKSATMRSEIQRDHSMKVLDYVDTPILQSSTRMGPLTNSLLARFGKKMTWVLAINDLYFDYATPALRAAGVPAGGPPQFISAGDGSVSAYQRIRSGQYQAATVPEPLNLQGWQLVDELNRAFAGAKNSGYVPSIHLVTKANINSDGGPKNVYDPGNGYRAAYKKIWGVM